MKSIKWKERLLHNKGPVLSHFLLTIKTFHVTIKVFHIAFIIRQRNQVFVLDALRKAGEWECVMYVDH